MTPTDSLQTLVPSSGDPVADRSRRMPTPANRIRKGVLRRRRRALADLGGTVAARGPLGFVRPGFNNLGPSAPFVFRFARHFEHCVIAYACDGPGLREAREVDGVPVPDDLVGRIFVVGEPDWCILSFEAASNLFLEQLLTTARAGLPGLSGDALLRCRATFLGHSQGALEGLPAGRAVNFY